MKSRIRNMARCGSAAAVLAALTACGGSDSGLATLVTPPPPPRSATYTVGGTVTGLSGSGLFLHAGFGNDLRVSAAGTFTFDTHVVSGTRYSVFVAAQPSSPAQYCSVANASGIVAAANVTNVSVTCANGYTVGGTVSGLVGSGLVIQISASGYSAGGRPVIVGNPLQINSNGAFSFDRVYPGNTSNGTFVRIRQQPASPTQLCVVNNARISIQAANVTDVAVVCSQFAYFPNAGDSTVSAYTVDAASGALAAVGTPVATGTSPHAIVGTQDKRYVFVGNEGSNDISIFAVNSASGTLTAVPGSPFAAGTDPKALAVYQALSTYLYVANAGSDTVSAFAVDTTSGSLTPLSPAMFATGKGPSSIAVDLNGQFIYVANNGGSNDVSAFSVDSQTGILTPVTGSPFPAGANPLSLALGVTGKFLFTANPDATNSSISGFNVDTNSGALTPLSGSPFPLAVSHHIATDRTGTYLYATAGTGVVGYGIDGTTGMLTPVPGFPVVTGTDAYSVTLDPTNEFLYVANDGAANVAGYRLDDATGGLTILPGSPFAAGTLPDFLAIL
jgi:6-phosphogluconolactonase (cycloisomerase 2 family)